MKKIICFLCGLLFATANIHATTLFSDSFSYPNGNLLGQGPWIQNGASIVNPIQASGGVATMLPTGQDLNAALSSPFSLVDGISFYIGSTINISAATATGDYFLHWSPATGSSVFISRLHARSSGGGFQLGYLETSGTGASLTYGSTVLNLNQNYRVVVGYNVVAGGVNDTANVYVNPTDYVVEGNNTPYLTDSWTSVLAETVTLGAVNLRQGGTTTGATLSVDDLYIGTTLADMQVIVPEPTSLCLVMVGAGAALLRRRKA